MGGSYMFCSQKSKKRAAGRPPAGYEAVSSVSRGVEGCRAVSSGVEGCRGVEFGTLTQSSMVPA